MKRAGKQLEESRMEGRETGQIEQCEKQIAES